MITTVHTTYIETEIAEIKTALSKRKADIKLSVHETLVQRGETAPFMTKAKAYRIYGRKQVENWISWGLLEEIKDGDRNSGVRLEVSSLIALSERCSRNEFYSFNREPES